MLVMSIITIQRHTFPRSCHSTWDTSEDSQNEEAIYTVAGLFRLLTIFLGIFVPDNRSWLQWSDCPTSNYAHGREA